MDGECLETEYVNSRTPMRFKCRYKDHKIWLTRLSIIKDKSWCPACAKEKAKNKNGLKTATDHALTKGGACLSTEYKGANHKMTWQCGIKNHKAWAARYADVISSGTWCPECGETKNLQEFRTRHILNHMFNTNFIKTRSIDWNKNQKTGRTLELDGYSQQLGIAFEFQGRQHVKNHFGLTKAEFEKSKQRDQIKKENCRKNGVVLIEIHERRNHKHRGSMSFYESILTAIKKAGLTLPITVDHQVIAKILKDSPEGSKQEVYLKKAKEHASSKGGKCLSQRYVSSRDKLEWRCHDPKHKSWHAKYSNVLTKNGSWCPECGFRVISIKKSKTKDGLSKNET